MPPGPLRPTAARAAPRGMGAAAAQRLWYALFAMQARENARLVSEQQPQNAVFNFFFWRNWLVGEGDYLLQKKI